MFDEWYHKLELSEYINLEQQANSILLQIWFVQQTVDTSVNTMNFYGDNNSIDLS